MWLVLFNAMDEFGVKEEKGGVGGMHDIEMIKNLVAEQACQGALRIAGLIGVLTSNGYLVSK